MDFKFKLFVTNNHWIFLVVVGCIQFVVTASSNCPTFFKHTGRKDEEVNVTKSDLQKCALFNDLVDKLEALNILIPRDTSCYTLLKVGQTYGPKDPNSNSQTFSVTFHFQENFKTGNTLDKTSIDTTMCTTGTVTYHAQGRQSQNENDTKNGNDTVALATSINDGDSSGLSHTQVVVIATCSAVVGTFFILAAALRIRNCMKRIREDQQTTRRSNNYRLPLSKGPNSLEGHSRKTSSTHSQQNSLLDKDGSTFPNSNSPSACREPLLLDTTPRLIVTAPSTAASTPADSRSFIQFIDEESDNTSHKTEEKNEDSEDPTKEESEKLSDIVKPLAEKSTEEVSTFDTKDKEGHSVGVINVQDENEIERNHIGEDDLKFSCASQEETSDISPVSIAESHSITVGLTQSDDSLSSHNPSYCYGNQVEYSDNGGYGNVGYCPQGQNEEIFEHDTILENDPINGDTNGKTLNFNTHFSENNATSFERDEMRNAFNDKMQADKNEHGARPSLKDTHNVISLDQYEQRHKLQRQGRTLQHTNSIDSDAY
ncbi:uncharacterized protein LOC127720266 [Mytilus californianus]|uniref:uncharacterized protein LOC127720266 n=1 Tax=Mytilus californianus TaxID=6549 RepID=UPI0022464ED6|nr:uncharacterized protein LOC127720266 [Mytilus californianus]XP_052082726.1 uncharacterized protein LOC127720266 [Mytilus californianus]XP_052082727.1 uncharacterized protein LOC127720266 [Mytilus californianus]